MQVQDFPNKGNKKCKNPKHIQYLFCLICKD